MTSDEREYVLGTDDAELLRLGLQHRLWSAQAFTCWERAGVTPGATVLDVGAGPGFGSIDLAQLVTPSGHVIAVDESERFLRHLAERARALGISHVETRTQDVQRLDVPPPPTASPTRGGCCASHRVHGRRRARGRRAETRRRVRRAGLHQLGGSLSP
jgi:SAM-dependent methyltransferase